MCAEVGKKKRKGEGGSELNDCPLYRLQIRDPQKTGAPQRLRCEEAMVTAAVK